MIDNTKKIVYLLDVIRKSTKGYSNEINSLYLDVIKQNSDVLSLSYNLNKKYNFYKGIGKSLAEESKSLLGELESDPENALQTIRKIGLKNEMLIHQADVCEKLLRSPNSTLESITIIEKKKTSAYNEALKQIAATCVYLIVLYTGANGIKNLTWFDGDGIQEHIHSVNTKFLPAIENMKIPEYSWIIEKKKMGGRALIGDKGFVLYYKRTEEVNKYCSALIKEPIGTHAFLNVMAYERDEVNVPFCWGIGNILSVTPKNAISLLTTGVVEKPRSPFPNEYNKKMLNPASLLKLLYNGKNYCASPETLVSLMNQWEAGYYINKMQEEKRCIFCGRLLNSNKLVCSSHFVSEL